MTAVKVSPAGPTPDVISRVQLDEMEAVVSAAERRGWTRGGSRHRLARPVDSCGIT